MTQPIYADFNGITTYEDDSEYTYLDLCGYGTICDLNRFKIKLKEGMKLTFYEPNDIKVEAIICFMSTETDNHNPNGKWFGKFKMDDVRDSTRDLELKFSRICFNCDFDFENHTETIARQYNELCPECGTSIMYALMPPKDNRKLLKLCEKAYNIRRNI